MYFEAHNLGVAFMYSWFIPSTRWF